MPKASDGKEFPYTKEGLVALKNYNERLKKKKKNMGNKKADNTSKDKTESPYNKVRSDNAPNT